MKENKPIIIWLLLGCLLIFIMVIIGGITRLTHSGLSMVKWNLIMGAIPPLNEKEWLEMFNLYKQFPEYKINNYNFTLSEFKSIFFWEYFHRLIGRLLGLVFIIPFTYFLIKRKLSKKLIFQTSILLVMGALQGAIGWWMVKSGLVNNPDVSHYRLAVHLIVAFLTFAYTFWVVLHLISPDRSEGNKVFSKLSTILLITVVVQIIYGAFVAGLNAGFIHNTWPLMSGEWIHSSVYFIKPLWKNFFEGLSGVQFIHRTLALLILAFVVFMWFKGRKLSLTNKQIKALNILLAIIVIQTLLGIFTLILVVPVWLAVIHQVGAFVLLTACVYSLYAFKKIN